MAEMPDLRERIARRFCALHNKPSNPVACTMGYEAADAAIDELRAGGLTADDLLTIGLTPQDARVAS